MSFRIHSNDWWVFRDHPVGYEEADARGLVRGFGFPAIDGDTPTALLDLGHYDETLLPIRLPGVDSPETRGTDGAELERAREALQLTDEFTRGQAILARGSDEMSFRRVVSEVYVWVGEDAQSAPGVQVCGVYWCSLGELLVANGLADRSR